MSNHTPGPWKYDKNQCVIISESEWFIEPSEWDEEGSKTTVIDCRGAMGGNNTEADARLIAAAPELLKACQLLAAWDMSDGDTDLLSQACSYARAAIAKAEGE